MPLEGLLSCLLNLRVDGENDGVARLVHARERIQGILPVGVIRMAGEGVVHRRFDACGAVLGRDVSNGVSGEAALRIRAHIGAVCLLEGLCERHAV